MKFKIDSRVLVILFLILLILPNLVIGESSSFELVMRTNNQRLNPGDSFQMKIYISGFSALSDKPDEFNIDYSKLVFYFNHDIKIATGSISGSEIIGTSTKVWMQNIHQIIKQNGLFLNSETEDFLILNGEISNEAKGGDYTIHGVFSYFNGERWEATDSHLSIHVNSWFERNQKWSILIALISLFGLGLIWKGLQCLGRWLIKRISKLHPPNSF